MPPSTRLRFPEDRTAYVYGAPGEPIRTPPRTGIKIFTDQPCTLPADIRSSVGVSIPFATIYTGDDGLLPEFLGPEDYLAELWARVVGGTGEAYPLYAQYSEQIHLLPTLLSGNGQPSADLGVPGSFYITAGPDPVIYGPKTQNGWPSTGTNLKGPRGEPGTSSIAWVQNSPLAVWDIAHTIPYEPNVATIDSSGMEIFGDVTYPAPGRVVIFWGAPESGRAVLT